MATKKKTKKKESSKSGAFEFVVAALKKDPKVAFADVRDAAQKKGLVLYPIVYGRAKAHLGLVPVAKRGQGKAAKRKASGRGPGRPPKSATKRGPGRPRKDDSGGDLAGIVGQINELQREHEKLQRVLEKISDLVDEAM